MHAHDLRLAGRAIRGTVWIHGEGRIVLGHGVVLDAEAAPIELHAARGATLTLGDDCHIEAGCSLEATSSVTVGARCRLGTFSKVMDNHFHPLLGDRTERPAAIPVVIEDDVWIGERAILLPGTHVGRGSRIGPGMVVRRRVPPESRLSHREDRRLDPKKREPLPAPHGWIIEVRMPSPFVARLRRYLGVLRARWLFRGCRVGALVNAQSFVRVVPHGTVILGDRVQFVRGVIPTTLLSHGGGEIVIGPRTIFNHAAWVEARRSVRIGARCMIASRVMICDSGEDGVAPIVIGDDVWLAHGVTLAPGVTIGAGSVVSAGSVVRRDVPPGSLASGDPAVCAPLSGIEATVGQAAVRRSTNASIRAIESRLSGTISESST